MATSAFHFPVYKGDAGALAILIQASAERCFKIECWDSHQSQLHVPHSASAAPASDSQLL